MDLHETYSDVRDRLNVLQRRHRDFNNALIDRLAQDYHEEALAEYLSKDDAIESDDIDVRPHYRPFSRGHISQYPRRVSMHPSNSIVLRSMPHFPPLVIINMQT